MSIINGNGQPGDLPGWLYRVLVVALLGWQLLTTLELDKSFDTFVATTTMTLAEHEDRLNVIDAKIGR